MTLNPDSCVTSCALNAQEDSEVREEGGGLRLFLNPSGRISEARALLGRIDELLELKNAGRPVPKDLWAWARSFVRRRADGGWERNENRLRKALIVSACAAACTDRKMSADEVLALASDGRTSKIPSGRGGLDAASGASSKWGGRATAGASSVCSHFRCGGSCRSTPGAIRRAEVFPRRSSASSLPGSEACTPSARDRVGCGRLRNSRRLRGRPSSAWASGLRQEAGPSGLSGSCRGCKRARRSARPSPFALRSASAREALRRSRPLARTCR